MGSGAVVSTPTSEVLYRAADLIEERGWQKGGDGWVGGASDPLCLEGGIQAAAGISDNFLVDRCPAYRAVFDYLGAEACTLRYKEYTSRIRLYVWNDASARTADEVIATLRAAAVIEAAKENTPAYVETRESVTA